MMSLMFPGFPFPLQGDDSEFFNYRVTQTYSQMFFHLEKYYQLKESLVGEIPDQKKLNILVWLE